mmetsp:Transcript_8975/g.13805  ORF Transcript_8975/g.13805 Transcript_8975/m.13805 type:complete len:593 (-) Transcript_8975:114-1892(-)
MRVATEEENSSPAPPIERTRGRHQFVSDQVIGTLVSVSWAYILQQQIDPRQTCPGTDRERCWGLLAVYAINMVAGVFYTPALIVCLMRLVGRIRRQIQNEFWIDLLKRFITFATTGATMQWSISVSTTLSQLLGELQFVVSSGHVESSGSSSIGPPRPGGNNNQHHPHNQHGPRNHHHNHSNRRRLDGLTGVTIKQLLVLQLVNFETCAFALAIFTIIMVRGNAMIKYCTTPFQFELAMLLRGSLHYASAYAVITVITGIWFLPIDVATALTNRHYKAFRFFWSLIKSFTVFFTFRSIARAFPPVNESIASAIFAQDRIACIKALSHKTLSVIACLSVFDTITNFLNDVLTLKNFWLILGFFLYAFIVLLIAILRRSLLTSSHEEDDTDTSSHEEEKQLTIEEEGSLSLRIKAIETSDKRFYDTFEAWTCCFALWIPYELLLIQAYDLSWSITATSQDWLSHSVRFIWQLTLGLFILATCVALASICNQLATFVRAWNNSFYTQKASSSSRTRRRSSRHRRSSRRLGGISHSNSGTSSSRGGTPSSHPHVQLPKSPPTSVDLAEDEFLHHDGTSLSSNLHAPLLPPGNTSGD